MEKHRLKQSGRIFLVRLVASIFLFNCVGPLPAAHADLVPQAGGDFRLPAPGTMIGLSPPFNPPILEGLKVHPENPILFDFIVDTGVAGFGAGSPRLRSESEKLIKYFLAALAIPGDDLWVNLSPYEKDRMIPFRLGQTIMGRDMLAEDYILKQLAASLVYPENDPGKEFWSRVYAQARRRFGSTDVPLNSFNKVWIVADRAKVYVHGNTAFLAASHMKVMLEQDYLSLQKHGAMAGSSQLDHWRVNPTAEQSQAVSQIMREVIIPELEKEVNHGRNFASLRQIFHSMILAAWYKKALKEALLNQVYSDKAKIKGVDVSDKKAKEAIYRQYLQAYKKGVFNYIKEDEFGGQAVPHKYFSGGEIFGNVLKNLDVSGNAADFDQAMAGVKGPLVIEKVVTPVVSAAVDNSQTAAIPPVFYGPQTAAVWAALDQRTQAAIKSYLERTGLKALYVHGPVGAGQIEGFVRENGFLDPFHRKDILSVRHNNGETLDFFPSYWDLGQEPPRPMTGVEIGHYLKTMTEEAQAKGTIFRARMSGILFHLTGLPGGFGIGNLGPVSRKFMDILAVAKQRVWQWLPVGPTHRGDNSPYNSSSAFAGNPLLISPELLLENGWITQADLDAAPRFPEGRIRDDGLVRDYNQWLLEKAYKGFKKQMSSERPANGVMLGIDARALARTYGTISHVPDKVWDTLAAMGTSIVWLRGVWQESPESARLMKGYSKLHSEVLPAGHFVRTAEQENVRQASAYDVYQYELNPNVAVSDEEFKEAAAHLKQRGITLVLDFVANHIAVDSPLVRVPGLVRVESGVPARARMGVGHEPAENLLQLNYLDERGRRYIIDHILAKIADLTLNGGVRIDLGHLPMRVMVYKMWGEPHGMTWEEFDNQMPREFWQEFKEAVDEKYPGMLLFPETYGEDNIRTFQQWGYDPYNKIPYDLLEKGNIPALRDYLGRAHGGVFFTENHDEHPAQEAFGGLERMLAVSAIVWSMRGHILVELRQVLGMGTPTGAALEMKSPDAGIYPFEYPDITKVPHAILPQVADLMRFNALPVMREGEMKLVSPEEMEIRDIDGNIVPIGQTGLVPFVRETEKQRALVLVNHSLHQTLKITVTGSLNDIREKVVSQAVRIEEKGHGKLEITLPPYQYSLLEFGARQRPAAREFYQFMNRERYWLDDFALYQALKNDFGGKPWYRWPAIYKRRDANALKAFAGQHSEDIERIKFEQFIFDRQEKDLREHARTKGIKIFGDMPIYVARDSADVWAHPELFQLDEDLQQTGQAGAPPDSFSADGQKWGNPLYNWEAHQRQGFQWWITRMRRAFELYDYVRIDHFRGLVQYWDVPMGAKTAKAEDGAKWQNVPTHNFLEALMRAFPEYHRRLPIIAEDLGDISEDVWAIMDQYGLPGMRISEFAENQSRHGNRHSPFNYPVNAVAYAGTHDNKPAKLWMEGLDEGRREDQNRRLIEAGVDPGLPAGLKMIALGMGSAAAVHISRVQDALNMGQEGMDNLPGTTQGNWGFRLTQAEFDEFGKKAGTTLRDLTIATGRVPGLQRPSMAAVDHAMNGARKKVRWNQGGIDLNARNMRMDVYGQKISVKFDRAMAAQFERKDFTGVRPVILEIRPMADLKALTARGQGTLKGSTHWYF